MLTKAAFQRNIKRNIYIYNICSQEVRVPGTTLGLLNVLLSSDEILDFQRLGSSLLSNPSLRAVQTFLGKAIFALRAVELGRIHLRALKMAVITGTGSRVFNMNRETRDSARW